MGNIAEHPYEIHHHHFPKARHDDPDAEVLGHWILAAAILGSSMAFINGTVTNVALPSIQSDLGVPLAQAQWVVQVYALLLATLLLVGGSLGDHFGHRRVFVLGLSIFALGSVGCAVAASPGQLIAARVVQALGAAGLIPGSLAILGAVNKCARPAFQQGRLTMSDRRDSQFVVRAPTTNGRRGLGLAAIDRISVATVSRLE